MRPIAIIHIYIDRAKLALHSEKFVFERKQLKVRKDRTLHTKTLNLPCN
jgi:hypothetical protein